MAQKIDVKLAKERLAAASARLRSAVPGFVALAVGSGVLTSVLSRKAFRKAAIQGIRWAVHAAIKSRKSA